MEYVRVQGAEVPAIGLGTWKLTGEQCYETVSTALDLGYRHLDTAQYYGNERQVGRALADSDVDREDVFLTTKIKPTDARREDLLRAARNSLDRLGVDSVDLLLLHWPNPLVDVEETMGAMATLRDEGSIRHAGVSNFSLRRLKRVRQVSPMPILTDQVAFHPHRPRRELLSYCQEYDTMLTAYSPLAHGGLIDEDVLRAIGANYEKSGVQVALRWSIQHHNVAVIPKATSRDHLADNIDVFDFTLTDDEMQRITRPSLLKSSALFLKGQLGV